MLLKLIIAAVVLAISCCAAIFILGHIIDKWLDDLNDWSGGKW